MGKLIVTLVTRGPSTGAKKLHVAWSTAGLAGGTAVQVRKTAVQVRKSAVQVRRTAEQLRRTAGTSEGVLSTAGLAGGTAEQAQQTAENPEGDPAGEGRLGARRQSSGPV